VSQRLEDIILRWELGRAGAPEPAGGITNLETTRAHGFEVARQGFCGQANRGLELEHLHTRRRATAEGNQPPTAPPTPEFGESVTSIQSGTKATAYASLITSLYLVPSTSKSGATLNSRTYIYGMEAVIPRHEAGRSY
jgi:hypothetical protein